MVFNSNDKDETSKMPTNSEYYSEYKSPPIWEFWRARRYVVTFMLFLGFINTYCLRVNLSVAIVAMTQYYNVTLANGTTIVTRDFDWDTKIQGYLLSSFFYGYIFTQFIGAYLGIRFGGKIVFAVGIGMASILTILTPVAAYLNVYLLLVVRILEGLFEGVIIPCSQTIWTNWAPKLERSRLITIAISGTYIGTVICLPLSAQLATHLGWESIFYVFGAVGCLWCVFWLWLIKDSPTEDSKISNEELKYITNSLEGYKGDTSRNIPVWSIITSPPVWALIVASSSEIWGFYTLLTQLPKFMKYALKFNLSDSGFVSALPYVAVTFVVQIAGHLGDYVQSKNVFTVGQLRKIFLGVGFSFQCTFMIISVHWVSTVTTTFCLVLAIAFGGFAMAGFAVNNLDLSPNYASIIVGIANTFATLPGIISPILTGYLVTDETSIEQWRIIFYIAGGIYLIGGLFYCIFGSGDLQPWDKIPGDLKETAKETYVNPNFQSEENIPKS
ncbi:sialin-like [Diabrotica undecimpunctata]|uniref:sialin-like n=1 Tax=Diabrotica undecimpunctata TaxID=50387 RepID=UPI003B637AE5